ADGPAAESLFPAFEAWRIVRLGSREVIDAVVTPEHRAPSPSLAAALARWPGAYYWTSQDHSGLVLVRPADAGGRERWFLHAVLAMLTIVCALGAGAALAGEWRPPRPPPDLGAFTGTLAVAFRFFTDVAGGAWREILAGSSFAFPLLGILLVHELGHYFAARRYAIDASPPFFLPVPPTLSPIGSLGAFLRLRSPVLDRRQLLDVGAAGPLAGFVVAVAVLIWGYSISQPLSLGPDTAGEFVTFAGRRIYLGDSILPWGLREHFFPDAAAVYLSLPAFAGWVGAFVTGLNLMPLSQLDGGHVLYALLGRRQTAVGFLTLVALFVLGFASPSWWLRGLVALLVGGGRWTHPSVIAPDRPVPPERRWIGWACVVVFAITFVPVPFR